MANVIYRKAALEGSVVLPPSKSAAHRAVLCAALSRGRCRISNLDLSEDLRATISAVEALGAVTRYSADSGSLEIDAQSLGKCEARLPCGESGSTLRFLIPIAAALGTAAVFTGEGRLPQRPLGVYTELLPEHGIEVETEGGLPLRIKGQLRGGTYVLPGNVSSQFITGLLFALPLLPEDSELRLSSPLESKGYVDLTCGILRQFGICMEETEWGWRIPGGQKYLPHDYRVEADWSQAAFFLCMAALAPGGKVLRLKGLREDSLQGDKTCAALFQRFGLTVEFYDGVLKAWNPHAGEPFSGLRGFTIDAAQIPDMVPALSVCAALAQGQTRIVHAERLRLKESDRLAAMANAIHALGGRAEATADGMNIEGVPFLKGGTACGVNDHRVVMALAAAALKSEGPVEVTDAWSIRKSYPGFFQDYQKLGGTADVVDLG